MKLPLAATHLARVVQVTCPGSLCRALDDGRLALRSRGPDDELVLVPLRHLAKQDKVLGEEARALAEARKWPTALASKPYGWARLQGAFARDALPRLLRILDRECFELESGAREAGDDDVRSLALACLDARRSARHALVAVAPKATVPGAK